MSRQRFRGETRRQFLLFADSLNAQRKEGYIRLIKAANGENVQAIHCGNIGATVKCLAVHHFEEWLDTEVLVPGKKNIISWFDNKVSMKDTSQSKCQK